MKMRKNFGAKTWLYPEPVLIIAAYAGDGSADAMNAAWGGLSGSAEITMCLSPGHKTVKNILETKAFTVSIADAAHVTECDYVGIVSGNDVPDKLDRAGFTTSKAEFVDAPIIEELPMALECELISYDEESHKMTGRIVNINADERILDEEGNIDPAKFEPVIYDAPNSAYLKIGGKAGNAFSDGEKLK